MEQSIFMKSGKPPDLNDVKKALGKNFSLWNEIGKYVSERCPGAKEEWHYSKVGWNCRIKDKKRVIIYLMPGDSSFKASIVLGKRAVTAALGADLSNDVKAIITWAKAYAEGTGFRIIVNDKKTALQIIKLTAIKLDY